MKAIVIENLKYNYGTTVAVDGISLEIEKGEVFGLLGPNGAGKTTLLSVLTGIKRPSAGQVIIQGLNLDTQLEPAKNLIGYVPQNLALYPSLTAYDNLEFFCGIYGISRNKAKERIQEVLNIVKLADRSRQIVETYSGGMKRRLNIAIGLLHEPQILFLDEPTVGVDPQSRNAIFEAIQALNHNGLTVIYTTHYMEEAEKLCQRVAIIDGGRVIALNTPKNLCNSIGTAYLRASISLGDTSSLLSTLQRAPFIAEAIMKNDTLEITTSELQETLSLLLNSANRFGNQISSMNISNATLETVFLKLTGKGLRDEA